MDAEELPAGLRMRGQILRGDVEGPRRVSLLDLDIDAPNPRIVHTDVRDEIAAGISDSDIHGLADFCGLLLCGGDDLLCVGESKHAVLR
jgi:hypothetical protein